MRLGPGISSICISWELGSGWHSWPFLRPSGGEACRLCAHENHRRFQRYFSVRFPQLPVLFSFTHTASLCRHLELCLSACSGMVSVWLLPQLCSGVNQIRHAGKPVPEEPLSTGNRQGLPSLQTSDDPRKHALPTFPEILIRAESQLSPETACS